MSPSWDAWVTRPPLVKDHAAEECIFRLNDLLYVSKWLVFFMNETSTVAIKQVQIHDPRTAIIILLHCSDLNEWDILLLH